MRNRSGNCNKCRCNCDDNEDDNLLTISSRCGNGENTELLTISTGGICGNNNNNNYNYNNGNSNCNCNNENCNGNDNRSERIVLNAEVVPTNNGRSGAFRGCFRRRCW